MRLINCFTLSVEDQTSNVPPYVILSHTWEEEEVTLKDMENLEHAMQKKGFDKIEKTCQMAIAMRYHYAWVDTCCIDKTSSAELSEAINSMFAWYAAAQICFAYLSDLDTNSEEFIAAAHDLPASRRCLSKCRWFQRGWTLQELIAPREVRFFAKDWSDFSNKHYLSHDLSEITGIDKDILTGTQQLGGVLIGRRMSWAANRTTTRVEDMAYCLLGIFNINMPLLYGEGKKSFVRLQEEIMKQSTDLSILAWKLPEDATVKHTDVLAKSPAFFRDCRSLVEETSIDQRLGMPTKEYSITNQGLRTMGLVKGGSVLRAAEIRTTHEFKLTSTHPHNDDIGRSLQYLLPLECTMQDDEPSLIGTQLAIVLYQYQPNLYLRIWPDLLHPCKPWELEMPRLAQPQYIVHRTHLTISEIVTKRMRHLVEVRRGVCRITGHWPLQNWDVLHNCFLPAGHDIFWGSCKLDGLYAVPSANNMESSNSIYLVFGRAADGFFSTLVSGRDIRDFLPDESRQRPPSLLKDLLIFLWRTGYPKKIFAYNENQENMYCAIREEISYIKDALAGLEFHIVTISLLVEINHRAQQNEPNFDLSAWGSFGGPEVDATQIG
ncbi:Vegetative incompatibility protein [Paramyrothecium foliicola]|nr:Vegetative incompatibility protein [Paramyrothecium foliicola]